MDVALNLSYDGKNNAAGLIIEVLTRGKIPIASSKTVEHAQAQQLPLSPMNLPVSEAPQKSRPGE